MSGKNSFRARRNRVAGSSGAALTLLIAAPAGALKAPGEWNAGHGIGCYYYADAVVCDGYGAGRHRLEFDLGLTGALSVQRTIPIIGPVQTQDRPPARWTTVAPPLSCRRGPGAILVQCRAKSSSFRLLAHTWSYTRLECSILTPPIGCRLVTTTKHGSGGSSGYAPGTGGAPITGTGPVGPGSGSPV